MGKKGVGFRRGDLVSTQEGADTGEVNPVNAAVCENSVSSKGGLVTRRRTSSAHPDHR